jgi:hypothetical protein
MRSHDWTCGEVVETEDKHHERHGNEGNLGRVLRTRDAIPVNVVTSTKVS